MTTYTFCLEAGIGEIRGFGLGLADFELWFLTTPSAK